MSCGYVNILIPNSNRIIYGSPYLPQQREEVYLFEINETAPCDYVLTCLFIAACTRYSTYSEITFPVLKPYRRRVSPRLSR